MMGHKVDVISGPPYPNLSDQVSLVKLPGLNLFQTFSFKDRLKIFWMKLTFLVVFMIHIFPKYPLALMKFYPQK